MIIGLTANLIKSAIIIVLLFGIGFQWSVCPGFAQSNLGYATIEKVVGIFSVWSGKEPNKSLLDELNRYIDYGEMAERSLGQYWFELSSLERKEYTFVLRKLIEERYYPRWHKIFSRGKIEKLKEVDTEDSLYVKTAFTVGKKSDLLVWRLSKRQGTGLAKIISIAVDDKDLLTRTSLRVKKIIAKKGFKKLIAWMKDEAELEERQPEGFKSTASK